jgi:hypothetical protein
MKTLLLLAIYIASFVIIFFIVSFPAYIFVGSFKAVIYNGTWQLMYSLFIGWWTAAFPAREYYLLQEEYFDKIF